MWDLPGLRIKPVSSALAGRFLTTEAPGKPCPYLKKRNKLLNYLLLLLLSCPVGPILCDPMDCSTPGFPVLHHFQALPKFMFIALVMLSIYLILWCPLLLLPLIFPSIRDFPNESPVCIRGPKYWNFSFSISLSSEYSGLISLKIDWLDLLACPRDFQESSPAPQFEGINSLAFCLLYGPALATMCDHWEDCSLDYTDLIIFI